MNCLQAKVNVLGRLHPLSGDITPFGALVRVTDVVALTHLRRCSRKVRRK